MTIAISARFVAFRSVPARAAMVLTLDVPSADGQDAMRYLGFPAPGSSIHVALTVLGEGDPGKVVKGTYENCRTVSGRKALVLTVEVPGERGHAAIRALGVPTPDNDIQVAVVLLVGDPAAAPASQQDQPVVKPKDPGALAVTQAAIFTKDAAAQRWLLGRDYVPGADAGNDQLATAALREQLGIVSRRELREDPAKLKLWQALYRRYEIHLQGGDRSRRDA